MATFVFARFWTCAETYLVSVFTYVLHMLMYAYLFVYIFVVIRGPRKKNIPRAKFDPRPPCPNFHPLGIPTVPAPGGPGPWGPGDVFWTPCGARATYPF